MGGVNVRRGNREFAGRRGGLGFTMIELLVILAIIVVLSGDLLITGFFGARTAARTALCLSNQRQVATALSMYMGGNATFVPREGTVPPEATSDWQRRVRTPWPVALRPYLDDRVAVGEEPDDLFLNAPYYRDPARPRDQHSVHYVVNAMPMVSRGVVDAGARGDYRRRRGPMPSVRFRLPETTLYLTEFSDDRSGAIWRAMELFPPGDLYRAQQYDIWDVLHLEPSSDRFSISPTRHGGGGNGVFMDGHAATVPKNHLLKVDTWDDRDYGIRIEPLPRFNP